MKIAIITDTHFGARNDKKELLDFNNVFYEKVFFPTLKKHKIDTIWHLGDLVDRRKFINYNSLIQMRKMFLDKLSDMKEVHFIMGNHDMYYKHKSQPNSLEELLGPGIKTGKYKNFHIHTSPTIVGNMTVIPWICDENREEAYKLIDSNKTRFLFGHLQLSGFEMDRGRFAEEGEDAKGFASYDAVLTGHFHHKSSYANIHYLGSPYEMTWKDYKDTKGFHIFDTETAELDFIENHNRLFVKLSYDDSTMTLEESLKSIDDENIEGCYVKLIVKNKNNTFGYDAFIDKINEKGISDLQIVEDHYNLNVEADEEIIEQAEDTLTILNKYIESIDTGVDKAKLEILLKSLYDEAGLIRI